MDNTTLVLVAGAIGALVGTIVTALSNIVLTIINRRSEERKQLNELVMNGALTDYQQKIEIAKENARSGRDVSILPFDSFVIHHFLFISALTGRKYEHKKLKKRLMQVDEDYQEILEVRKYRTPTGERYQSKKRDE